MFCTPLLRYFHTLLSNGFRSGELGHSSGGINYGVSFCNNPMVTPEWCIFQVSQGSVDTLFRWGKKRLRHFAANLFGKLCTKLRQNRWSFIGDITKTFRSLFSGHSVHLLTAVISYTLKLLMRCSFIAEPRASPSYHHLVQIFTLYGRKLRNTSTIGYFLLPTKSWLPLKLHIYMILSLFNPIVAFVPLMLSPLLVHHYLPLWQLTTALSVMLYHCLWNELPTELRRPADYESVPISLILSHLTPVHHSSPSSLSPSITHPAIVALVPQMLSVVLLASSPSSSPLKVNN